MLYVRLIIIPILHMRELRVRALDHLSKVSQQVGHES